MKSYFVRFIKKGIVTSSYVAITLFGVINNVSAEITFKSTQLTENLYMLEGQGGFAGGNLALSVGSDGVIMIDNAMPNMLDKLNAQIKTLAGKPVDFLINTHIHGDHTGNNAYFGSQKNTRIVAHDKAYTFMKSQGIPASGGAVPAKPSALPVITYNSEMSFRLNNETIQLVHVPQAHTDGDTIVVFQEKNIIHAGDIFFNGMFPFIDLAHGGSVDGYISAQKHILSLADKDTRIIPGHGPIATAEALRDTVNMIEKSKQRIQALVTKGLTEKEVLKANPLADLHDKWNWSFITTEKMTQTLYRDLNKHSDKKQAMKIEHKH